MSIELVRLSNHLILCCPLLLLPSIINNKNLKIEKNYKKKKIATQFCKRVHGTKKIRCRSLPCTQAGLVFHRTPEPQSEALKEHPGNPLVVQWLRLDTLTDRSGSIPGQGTKIPQALRHGKKKKKNTQYRCRDILNSLEATSGASWLLGGAWGNTERGSAYPLPHLHPLHLQSLIRSASLGCTLCMRHRHKMSLKEHHGIKITHIHLQNH